jgi:hypothetical protein
LLGSCAASNACETNVCSSEVCCFHSTRQLAGSNIAFSTVSIAKCLSSNNRREFVCIHVFFSLALASGHKVGASENMPCTTGFFHWKQLVDDTNKPFSRKYKQYAAKLSLNSVQSHFIYLFFRQPLRSEVLSFEWKTSGNRCKCVRYMCPNEAKKSRWQKRRFLTRVYRPSNC